MAERERVWHTVGKSPILVISNNCKPKNPIRKKEQDTVASNQDNHQAKKAEPTDEKLNYVPGPIGSLIDQAEVVGLQLAVNQQGELEFRRDGRAPIPFTKSGKKAWSKEIKRHINDNLLRELHEAVEPAYDRSGQEIPPRRKDMVGFPANVDRRATMALLNNLIRRPRNTISSNVLDDVGLELDKNPKHRATPHSIMAGCIRPNARLAKSHGLTPKCRCGAEKEDVQHGVGCCPDHAHIRGKYESLIEQVARQDGETQEQLLTILQSQTFKKCGIITESEQLIQWQDLKDDGENDAAEIPPLTELTTANRSDELWSEEWLRTFTDGGVAASQHICSSRRPKKG